MARRLARRPLLAGLLLGLTGCGFRPLLKRVGDAGVQQELAAIELKGLDGRLGQLIRNALLDELNPTGAPVPARYVLDMRANRRVRALAIQLNSTITRFNLTVTVRFSLRQRGQTDVLYASTVQRVASYDVSRQPFADLVAEQTAEQRAAKEIGTQIRTLLAFHFARRGSA